MFDPYAYTITVQKRNIDGDVCYEARVKELPDQIVYGDTHNEAYDLIIETIETTAVLFAKIGKPMPTPLVPDDEDHSGRVTLRLPKSLHKTLVVRADSECVSLNQLISTALAHFEGFNTATTKIIQPSAMSKWAEVEANLIAIQGGVFHVKHHEIVNAEESPWLLRHPSLTIATTPTKEIKRNVSH